MSARRVTIPATVDLGWVVTVPEFCAGETRPASPGALHRLEAEFGPAECPGCFRFVERAIEAISLALDEFDDEPSQGGPTD
jgi:hypothetical protein